MLWSHIKSRILKNKGIPDLQIVGDFEPFEEVQMIGRPFFDIFNGIKAANNQSGLSIQLIP